MRNYEKVKSEYLCYLMNRAQVEAEGIRGYLCLCSLLQETEFIPIVEMDENRCSDCRNLRMEFANDVSEPEYMDILDGMLSENGTMMELLTVLAEKIEYEMADSEYEASTRKWFLEMLTNCGLGDADNGHFEEDSSGRLSEDVACILDTVIFRKFGWDGENGLFPLRWPRGDQRYEELIVQMNNYLEENYDIC